MKIEFWKPTLATGQIKATIHRSGNLGFSFAATQKMEINEKSYVKLGINKEDSKDNNLYLVLTKENDENAIKVNKAGKYYYLNTKSFFNELGIDYINKKIIYDIAEIQLDFGTVYKLIKREIVRKNKK